MRSGCGASFSFSAISTTARAKTSEPPPGALCTTNSTGRLGTKPCGHAQAGDRHAIAASSVALAVFRFIVFPPFDRLYNHDMPFATINGIRVNYQIDGTGPHLLMFAPGGFRSVISRWTAQGGKRE